MDEDAAGAPGDAGAEATGRVENEWDADEYDDQLSVVYELADDLVDLLDPAPGERIADVGCGTGHLTAEIAERGADVVGVDRSPEMVARAREVHPSIPFHRADVRALPFDESLDAVFTNAALHWVDDQDAALSSIHDALRPGAPSTRGDAATASPEPAETDPRAGDADGGRLVAELGGAGNVGAIRDAVRTALAERGYEMENPWHFPTPGEYASRLEAHGFEVRLARLFDRPTPLDGGADGIATWLDAFGDAVFEPLSDDEVAAVVADVEERLRDALWHDGQWVADYRRLRIVAVRR